MPANGRRDLIRRLKVKILWIVIMFGNAKSEILPRAFLFALLNTAIFHTSVIYKYL